MAEEISFRGLEIGEVDVKYIVPTPCQRAAKFDLEWMSRIIVDNNPHDNCLLQGSERLGGRAIGLLNM